MLHKINRAIIVAWLKLGKLLVIWENVEFVEGLHDVEKYIYVSKNWCCGSQKNIAFIVNSLSDFDFNERNQKYEYECECE